MSVPIQRISQLREETFGPVAALFKFETEDEVIELASNTEFGLASYFYAKDVSKIFRVAEALEYEMVGVNTGLISTEVAPLAASSNPGRAERARSTGSKTISRSSTCA
jgi:succinate-semialdehyde dehydrogenase/glutarate-semialdehyde dehydrogenase